MQIYPRNTIYEPFTKENNQNRNYLPLWVALGDDAVDRGTAVLILFSKPMAVGFF